MKLKKEVNTQRLVEKNEKILDLNNIKFILSEFEEYQVLVDLIRKINHKNGIKRILIIGDDLNPIYSQVSVIFPNARFFLANKSREILESFRTLNKDHKNYSTYILDVVKGVSLHDFIYNNIKFDLVIANKIYSRVKRKKRYHSIRFLFKFYLRQNGILCLINYVKNSRRDKFNLLKATKPVLKKEIPVKKEKYAIQFLIYTKKNKYS